MADPNALTTSQNPNAALQPLQPLAASTDSTGTVTNNYMPNGAATSAALSTPAAPVATGMIAATRAVDPATGTVAGQFDTLTNSNNPLMVAARASSDQQMNSRGLLNSSLASSASDLAAYQAALPIANADATNVNTTAAQNQAAVNAASSQNATAANQMTLTGSNQAVQVGLANLDAQTKTNVENIDANYKTLMQTSSSAAQIYQQAVTNLSNISLSTTMDQAAKNAASANQMALLQTGMSAIGAISNLNLGSLLQFNTTGNNVNSGTPVNTPVSVTPAATAATGVNQFGFSNAALQSMADQLRYNL